MKTNKTNLITQLGLLSLALFTIQCTSDDHETVNIPTFEVTSIPATAFLGDSLAFSVHVDDSDTPLSTLKVSAFYGEEEMEQTVIRTKNSDYTYSGKIYFPYYASIPDGQVKLHFTLQNIDFAIQEKIEEVATTRPDFPYVTLHTEEGDITMTRSSQYTYHYVGTLPKKVKGYIETPTLEGSNHFLTFGLNNEGEVTEGSQQPMLFSNSEAGEYELVFNTKDYQFTPQISLQANGIDLTVASEDHYTVDLSLSSNQPIVLEGLGELTDWWIDTDFFDRKSKNEIQLAALNGTYRIYFDAVEQTISARVLKDGQLASLQSDGTGAIWIIGDGVGKPNLSNHHVGWNTDNALCLAPVAKGIYQVTLIAGIQINTDYINFKFFHQAGWGGEFSSQTLTTTSDLIFVGDGSNGRDSGNLGVIEGQLLQENHAYRFTVDVTQGIDAGVLTVQEVPVDSL